MAARGDGEERQELKLSEAAQTLLDECRMVLPGIQALFGFQLIAVFNQRFREDLTHFEQQLHLIAIALVAMSIALLMTPPAYHRHRGSRIVTDTFLHVSSSLLLASMLPLTLGLSIDFYVIAHLVLDTDGLTAPLLALGLMGVLVFFWWVFPRMHALHRFISRRHRARHHH
jgi:uncharacterized protein DUF6328